MFITLELLEEQDACEEQRQLFEEHFPDGVEVTAEVCAAVADVFDWNWAAECLLPRANYDTRLAAKRAYWETVQVAHDAYQTAINPLFAAFESACNAASREFGYSSLEYQKHRTAALETYRAAKAPAEATYNQVRAAAFAAAAAKFPTEDPASTPAQP